MKSAAIQSSSSLENFIKLKGSFNETQNIPERCPHCNCKEFYKQSDFKRSIGLTVITLASLATMVLMAMGFNWFVIWSPMFVVLIFDRLMFRVRPEVALCYNCKNIFRGISAEKLEEIDNFELEIYDRYKYKEENA